jgi:ankyrin repeat protein
VALGADVTVEDGFGEVPLMKAALVGHLSTVKLLVWLGADPKYCCTKDRGTALHSAAEASQTSVLRYLVRE